MKDKRNQAPKRTAPSGGRLPVEARLLLFSMTIVSVAGLVAFQLGSL